jgi:hypothetical protein
MTQYNDLYMRCNLSDTGSVPRSGVLSSSPDIIPYGTTPVTDPGTFFTNNHSQDVGQSLTANQQNYIYTRAYNYATGPQTGSIYLYYSPASLLLYPSLWSENGLTTSQGVDHVTVSAASANQIVVSNDPFTWVPQLISNDHYCMISRVSTNLNPSPVPQTGDINEFANWISTSGGWAWRNVSIVANGSPTFTQTINYTQGATAGILQFVLQCQNVPVGAQVAFSCGTPGPNPLINLPPTTVTNGSSFVIGMVSNIPANFVSNISYSYWANGNPPPPGFQITLIAYYYIPPTQKALLKFARPMAYYGCHDENTHGIAQAFGNNKSVSIGPTPAIVVGSHATKM